MKLGVERTHQLHILGPDSGSQLAVRDGPVLLDSAQLLYLRIESLQLVI